MLRKIKRYINRLVYPPMGDILIFHRVTSNTSVLQGNRQYEVTPEFLEKTILEYKRKGYEFISIDQLCHQFLNYRYFRKRFVCFTLDDGYLDNYTEAYPIFEKYQCPFTIYVTTDYTSHTAFLWRYILADLIMENDTLSLANGEKFICKTVAAKNELFDQLNTYFSHKPLSDIRELLSSYNFSVEEYARKLLMSEEHLKAVSADVLCTIGSHTLSHPHLSWISSDEQKREVVESKRVLEKLIDKPILHFSYPYGDYTSESIKIVQEAGYKSAVGAWGGFLRHNQTLYTMSRCIITDI